jgi:transcriptional regulator with XRE-family HTH domain
VNKRIKDVRNALNLTQQEFADKIKIKRNTVATYEMGRSIPSDSAIALICREFDVNEEWLRNGTGEMFVQKSKDEQISEMLGEIQKSGEDTFKHRLVSALANLDEDGWNALEKLIDSIAKKNE